jgi:high-affinity iron transporter
MVFFAVAREGLESVFFLLAIFQQSTNSDALLGAVLGILVSIVLGYGIYAGGVRMNLRRFFFWTGIFILVVAAGILASTLRHFHEAGVWNSLQTVVVDLSNVLPVGSPIGTLLSGMFGYQDMPTLGEVIVYVTFLAISVFMFLRPATPRPATARAPRPSN